MNFQNVPQKNGKKLSAPFSASICMMRSSVLRWKKLTLVLAGAFTDETGAFHAGDVEVADECPCGLVSVLTLRRRSEPKGGPTPP